MNVILVNTVKIMYAFQNALLPQIVQAQMFVKPQQEVQSLICAQLPAYHLQTAQAFMGSLKALFVGLLKLMAKAIHLYKKGSVIHHFVLQVAVNH